jgi:hypothetical protein
MQSKEGGFAVEVGVEWGVCEKLLQRDATLLLVAAATSNKRKRRIAAGEQNQSSSYMPVHRSAHLLLPASQIFDLYQT